MAMVSARPSSARDCWYCAETGFGIVRSAAMAARATRPAAMRYFSISTGEIVSTSPMLSNP